MTDYERLASLLDALHDKTEHRTSFARCLQPECRELDELLMFSRVRWVDGTSPIRRPSEPYHGSQL